MQGHSFGDLTDLGQKQALLAGIKLKGVKFDEIIVSSLFRTM